MKSICSLRKTDLANALLPLGVLSRSAKLLGKQEQMRFLEKQAWLRARQVFQWVYQKKIVDFESMTNVSKSVRGFLREHFFIPVWEPVSSREALDGTWKVLWSLDDQKTIESVVIPAALDGRAVRDEEGLKGKPTSEGVHSERWKRLTVCISSQVGCAMKCGFCLTGIQGFDRHLRVEEIVTQVLQLRRKVPITNIVFMGMGEPLHNFENVVRACEILLDEDGMNFSKRKITVSTSGLVPEIQKLGERVDVSLAISLNGSHNEGRTRVMPINKRYPIEELLSVCKRYPLGSHRKITFEYVLLKDVNDADDDAKRLIHLLKGIPSLVNLIPFNAHSGADFERPSDARVFAFQKILLRAGITTTIRISRGRDILAACGQLRSLFGTAKGTERHRDAPIGAYTSNRTDHSPSLLSV